MILRALLTALRNAALVFVLPLLNKPPFTPASRPYSRGSWVDAGMTHWLGLRRSGFFT